MSRRQKRNTAQISSRRAPGPLNLLADSTGVKLPGDGEWLAHKHGTQRRRPYRKVHLAMDTASGDIHIIAIGRPRLDPRSQDYVARRIAAGHSKLEAIRCLKRYIAREVFGIIIRRHKKVNQRQIAA